MKTLILILFNLLTLSNVFSQNLVDTNPNFKSDLIRFEVVDSIWIRIDPIHNVVDSILSNEGLNESLVRNKLLEPLNQLRKEYGSDELVLNEQLSYNLLNSAEFGLPLTGITWSTYGVFSEYNYISVFDDRELSFLKYNIDVMCVDKDLFKDLINPNATQVGFYFTQNLEDKTYSLMIYVQ
jgi:hypothetical protein